MAGSSPNKVTLNIQIRAPISRISLETDESYDLKITADDNDLVICNYTNLTVLMILPSSSTESTDIKFSELTEEKKKKDP